MLCPRRRAACCNCWAVCLRLAAGGTVAGVGEAALRALTKLDQVLPARLRSQVGAVHDATVTLDPGLDRLASGTRCADDVGPRVPGSRARDGRIRRPRRARHPSAAGAVSIGDHRPRWYLMAYDRDRLDRRSPRLDRMEHVHAPRRARCGGLRGSVDQCVAVPVRRACVRYFAPYNVVAQHCSPGSATVEADSPDACVLTAGGDDAALRVDSRSAPSMPISDHRALVADVSRP